jgi:hypothetical protein
MRKRLAVIVLLMLVVGYLSADVTVHLIKRNSNNEYGIGHKYYPALYRIKERTIYPIHNRERIKSYEKGTKGTETSQIRSGYKVKK